MELNRDDIHDRLRKLAKRDKKRNVFGSAAHDYILNPLLDIAEVEAFESKHGISLPEDYKFFITEIGNGGAGPAYGLFPFGFDDDEDSWAEGQLLGDVGQPFPYQKPWNLDDEFWKKEPDIPEGISQEEEDRFWEEWDNLLEVNYWHPSLMNGAIPICHLGCALRQWLVVHGAQRGFVWDDSRADNAGVMPVKDANGKPVTFAAWYLAWLANAEQGRDSFRAPLLPRYKCQFVSGRREVMTAFVLVVAGVLIGLLLAIFGR